MDYISFLNNANNGSLNHPNILPLSLNYNNNNKNNNNSNNNNNISSNSNLNNNNSKKKKNLKTDEDMLKNQQVLKNIILVFLIIKKIN